MTLCEIENRIKDIRLVYLLLKQLYLYKYKIFVKNISWNLSLFLSSNKTKRSSIKTNTPSMCSVFRIGILYNVSDVLKMVGIFSLYRTAYLRITDLFSNPKGYLLCLKMFPITCQPDTTTYNVKQFCKHSISVLPSYGNLGIYLFLVSYILTFFFFLIFIMCIVFDKLWPISRIPILCSELIQNIEYECRSQMMKWIEEWILCFF